MPERDIGYSSVWSGGHTISERAPTTSDTLRLPNNLAAAYLETGRAAKATILHERMTGQRKSTAGCLIRRSVQVFQLDRVHALRQVSGLYLGHRSPLNSKTTSTTRSANSLTELSVLS